MNITDKIETCRTHVPGWDAIPKDRFFVRHVSGGLTNKLSCVGLVDKEEAPDKSVHQVLLREFGECTEVFFSRDVETAVFETLAELGVGPSNVGKFEGGRIEEFLDAKSLRCEQLQDQRVLESIGTQLGQLHRIDVDFLKSAQKGVPSVVKNMQEWWKEASRVNSSDPRHMRKLVALDLGMVFHEIQWLVEELAKLNSPLIFCHNDLQEGNILVEDDSATRLFLIDFEYSGYNNRGFDFGNLFCEMTLDNCLVNFPGYAYNPDKYPRKEQLETFFRAYLSSSGVPEAEHTDELIASMSHEGHMFALSSHLMWALWAIVQSENSTIEFGYLEYATTRLDAYFARKCVMTGVSTYAAQRLYTDLHKSSS